MSLIDTAKANGIEPHVWLADVLTRLPTTKDRDIASLLPLASPHASDPSASCKVWWADAYDHYGQTGRFSYSLNQSSSS